MRLQVRTSYLYKLILVYKNSKIFLSVISVVRANRQAGSAPELGMLS